MRIVNSLHADRPIIIDATPIVIPSAHILQPLNNNSLIKFGESYTFLLCLWRIRPIAEGDILSIVSEKNKKESLGIDALVVDQATLHHMILHALLAVCEDAIKQKWIGSAVYHHRICNAPINTQDVQTFIIAPFQSGLLVTSQQLHSAACRSSHM